MMNNCRRLTLFLLIPLLLLSDLCYADLPSLMSRLANAPHPTRHFTEQRYSELLLTPVTLHGTLSYSKDQLVKTILEPFAQRFTIEGDRLLIEGNDNSATQQIALSDHPPLLTFVTIFRATLRGDLATLQQHYLVDFSEQDNHWKLSLLPRDARVAAYLKSVTIEGNSTGIQRFHLEEQSGDYSIMELGEVAE